ncbi:solute carrier family 22 member 6-B-like isoform X3 [Cuculus canorus]|uniref:solute carrier family 22 member 6-B-like isoform X3 n=1 Tax=Cuculus canorus TaxID=55661 RepID=UPI0023AA39B0|nr:solute carrier family 22 member 6-B-like isoform X3 [Cuculus canorus]
MAFGDLLELLGGMGRFQVATILLLALPIFMMPSHNLLQNFTAATAAHRCRFLWEDNVTEVHLQELLKVWLPDGERCRRFVAPQWWLLDLNASTLNATPAETEPCGDGWTYDRSVFTNTIVTEWDLVCGSRALKQLAQSLYMSGVLVGAVVFGALSDRFGRRRLLTWCYLQMGVMGTSSSFAPTFTTYCLFRFLTGAAFSGVVLNSVSLSLEWTPTAQRALVGTLLGYCYTCGQFLLAGVAFAVPDWRRLQLLVALPFFAFFGCSWWLTESARWLLMVGRSQQALQELQKVAKINGKSEEGRKLDAEALRSHVQEETVPSRRRHSVLDLVRTPVLRRISCGLCFVWFSTSFAYYGLAMDLQHFDFNLYVIQMIFGAVDIPAKLVSILTITYVGRRFTQSLALILAGAAILANILVPPGRRGWDWATPRRGWAASAPLWSRWWQRTSRRCRWSSTERRRWRRGWWPRGFRRRGRRRCRRPWRRWREGSTPRRSKPNTSRSPFIPSTPRGPPNATAPEAPKPPGPPEEQKKGWRNPTHPKRRSTESSSPGRGGGWDVLSRAAFSLLE